VWAMPPEPLMKLSDTPTAGACFADFGDRSSSHRTVGLRIFNVRGDVRCVVHAAPFTDQARHDAVFLNTVRPPDSQPNNPSLVVPSPRPILFLDAERFQLPYGSLHRS